MKESMKKTGPPRPRPKPSPRAEAYEEATRKYRKKNRKKKEEPELYTLFHEDVPLGGTTYRVFLRVPRDELSMIVLAAVEAHVRGKKSPILGVTTGVCELRDEKEE